MISLFQGLLILLSYWWKIIIFNPNITAYCKSASYLQIQAHILHFGLMFCFQAFSNNHFSDLLTPPFSEEVNGLGLSVELDTFSEISLTSQSPPCDTPDPSLPSFQETYPSLGGPCFKMEEGHFNFGDQFPFAHQHHHPHHHHHHHQSLQQPSHLSSQCQPVTGCGSQAYDFVQLFSPLPNATSGGNNFQGSNHMQHSHQQRQSDTQLHSPMHSHSYGQHHSQPQIFESPVTTSQPLDSMPSYVSGFQQINSVPEMGMPNVGLKQRRGTSMTHRNHHLLK